MEMMQAFVEALEDFKANDQAPDEMLVCYDKMIDAVTTYCDQRERFAFKAGFSRGTGYGFRVAGKQKDDASAFALWDALYEYVTEKNEVYQKNANQIFDLIQDEELANQVHTAAVKMAEQMFVTGYCLW